MEVKLNDKERDALRAAFRQRLITHYPRGYVDEYAYCSELTDVCFDLFPEIMMTEGSDVDTDFLDDDLEKWGWDSVGMGYRLRGTEYAPRGTK